MPATLLDRKISATALLLTLLTMTASGIVQAASEDASQAINVAFVHVQEQSSYQSQRVYAGRTVATRAAELGFNRGGELAGIWTDIGEAVEAGQVLAKLDTRALESSRQQAGADISLARANLLASEADVQLASNTERRVRSLREQGHISKQNFDEADLSLRGKRAQMGVARANLQRAEAAYQAIQIALDEARIVAPFAGVIQARHADEGAQISPGQPVLRLVERVSVDAHVGVPTLVAVRLTPGSDYEIRWDGQPVTGHLKAVLPELDPATRTLTAVFEIKHAQLPLGAVVELVLGEVVADKGFWLPTSALTESDRGLWGVYVVSTDNIIQRRLVEVVHTEADRVFVRGTLSNADRVVKTGVHRIVPGQRVNATAAL
jgi:RND family efflux transporter MFP subunit